MHSSHRWKFLLLIWLLNTFLLTVSSSEGDNVIDYTKKLKEYLFTNKHSIETHIRPLKEPVEIQIQVFLRHVIELDIRNETLTAHILLSMNWIDKRLSWDPKAYGGVLEIQVTNKFVWTPDIMLYNGRQELDIFKNTLLKIYSSGKVLWINPLTVFTFCAVDVKRYPFDKHQCAIRLGSWTQSVTAISLSLKNSQILAEEEPNEDNGGLEEDDDESISAFKQHHVETFQSHSIWKVLNASANIESKFYKCCPDAYHTVAIYLTLERKSPQYLVTLVLPICTSMLIMITIFFFPPTSGEKISIGCFAILYLLLLDLYSYWTVPSNGSGIPNIVALIGAALIMATLSVILSVILLSLSSFSHHRGVPFLASFLGKITCLDLQNNQELFDTASSSMVGELNHTISEKRHEWVILAKAIDRIFLSIYIILVIILLSVYLS